MVVLGTCQVSGGVIPMKASYDDGAKLCVNSREAVNWPETFGMILDQVIEHTYRIPHRE